MSQSPTHSWVKDVMLGDIAEIRIDNLRKHRALYACRTFEAGDVIVPFAARITHTRPNYLTIQVEETEHIELLPEYLECTNHSCDPNCYFDTTQGNFLALKSIGLGDELTFFYPSTEWDMDRSFSCSCGSHNCLGTIQGAKYLAADTIKAYRFTDFISQKIASICP